MRRLSIGIAGLLLLAASPAQPGPLSLTEAFERFHDATRGLPLEERVARFRAEVAPLFPGFYTAAEGQSEAGYVESVARALDGFDAIRSRYDEVSRTFPQAYARATNHFRQAFPGFRSTVPAWLLHSLGRMDGGTRAYGGQVHLIFGADVIARVHDQQTLGPFLDHELFHVENSRWFKDCTPDTTIWCALWQEGAAVYVSGRMNPGATDTMLALTQPQPIRAAVDADWRGALCDTQRDFDDTSRKTYAGYFMGDRMERRYPARWGYYVGYRLLKRIGQTHSLAEIDHMDHAAAKEVLQKALSDEIAAAGGCR